MKSKQTDIRALCASWAVAVLLAVPVVSSAQQTRSVDVLGSITAEIDGQTREWLTINGVGDDKEEGSAGWSAYAPPAVPRPSHLSDEQFAAVMERMGGMFGAKAGPGGDDLVKVQISGFDPNAERMLRDGVLTIELSPFSAGDVDSLLERRLEANVAYFKDFGDAQGLFVSTDDSGIAATVAFEALEIAEGGGHAEGEFEAGLCPVAAMMGGGAIDPDDCLRIVGRFSTELDEH